MKYTIQINSSPNNSSSGYSAYRFIKTTIAMKHEVFRIFFYQEGIYHAFKYSTPPDDEIKLTQLWTKLANEHKVDLVVCISAAQKRGLLTRDETQRQGKQDQDLAEGFRISGLGQLLEGMILSDRFIEFS